MELTIAMRARIVLVCAIGAAIIGFGAFGFVQPDTPLDALTTFDGQISISDLLICAALAFAAGLVSYFAAYPYGRQIAGLAVPVGLGVWAFRSGTMASLLQVNREVDVRGQIYSRFQFECVIWLGVIAAGFAGVYVAGLLSKLKEAKTPDDIGQNLKKNQALNIAIAIVVSLIITHFAIAILAQDVKQFDAFRGLGYVIGQPSAGQIAFAVIVSFAIAAFVVKYYLSVGYHYVILSAVLLTIWTAKAYANPTILQQIAENWPANFFARASCAILPFQLASFATIGAIAGYWLAVQWKYSKENAEGKHGTSFTLKEQS